MKATLTNRRLALFAAALFATTVSVRADSYKDLGNTGIEPKATMWCAQATQGFGWTCQPVTAANPLPVSFSGSGLAVTGTFWQTTQPVSLSSLPSLPAGTNTIGAVVNQGSAGSANANSHAATSALASSLALKASAGNLYSVNATAVTGGAAGYLVVINAASAPTSGSAITPLDFCYFNGVGGCSLSHGQIPINYSTGIVALITTAASPFTFTSGTDTAAISGDFQ